MDVTGDLLSSLYFNFNKFVNNCVITAFEVHLDLII